MERRSRVLVAWPEDFVLEGEQLEELTAQLAPHADKIDELAAELNGRLTSPEVYVECKEAIQKTLGSFTCQITNRELQDTIKKCWERSDRDDEGKRKRSLLPNRSVVLSSAIWGMNRQGILSMGTDGIVEIVPQANDGASGDAADALEVE